jgi:hypothetical protein
MSGEMMKTIGDILSRDLTKQIEEVIQVNQTDEESVYSEIDEYVATDRIKEHYRDLLKAMADAPSEPTEGVGIWISGFFGSGKSSFAKNLGYVLSDPHLKGKAASELFKNRVKDNDVSNYLDLVNLKIPTEVVMFDVSKGSEVRRSEEKIAEIVYRALLMHLDYSTDFDVAELEIELEGDDELEQFISLCEEVNGQPWSKARKGARKLNFASAILHRMKRDVFPAADSWAKGLGKQVTTITVETVVERTFDLTARRRPGKAIAFIIDEVGRYVAHSANKIEDLRALVEQFGEVSKNRLKSRQAIAPVWIIVTSQEKLDEVVDAIGTKRVQIAKLQDRFRHRVDLAPADIREVATKRVLAKKSEAESVLKKLFNDSQGLLNAACRLEKTQKRTEVTGAEFLQFYPYLPHYIEMSIDIMSGIRLQPGAPKHFGGSNRTIIKQAYEMLVSERTNLQSKPIGTLVTLDKIFELVEGNLSSEKQKDISDITERYLTDSEDHGMAARVAKTIALLEFVRDVPRTEANIAACLVDSVGQPSPLAEVSGAIKRLEDGKFVRNTEEGWKLQTAQEKNWETERRGFDARPKDRNELTRETLRTIFEEPNLKTYRYKNLRTFRVGITVDGNSVGEGEIPLALHTADDIGTLPSKVEDIRAESRQERNKNEIYWVFPLTKDVDDLEASLFASRQMIAKYEQARAQNRITSEELTSLSNEKQEVSRIQSRLRDKMIEAVEKGVGLFRGVSREAQTLGKNAGEIFKSFFDVAFPDLYPKLELGSRAVTGKEVDEILKAANLSGLSPVFYDGDNGLALVVQQGSQWAANENAAVAKEILDYIKREHAYGNKVTGKILEEHFSGLGYGWERDIVKLVLAVLLRAGSVEVTHQGRRLRNYQEPQARAAFASVPSFRSASFSPRESVGLKTLTTAVQHLEELTGEEVDIEEGAIATRFRKVADEEMKLLLPLAAIVQANRLPGADVIEEYRQALTGIQASASDDCVRILAGEGTSFKESRDNIQQMREAVDSGAAQTMANTRVALDEEWPVLQRQGVDLLESVNELKSFLEPERFYKSITAVSKIARDISEEYRDLYARLHEERSIQFASAIDELKGRAEWALVPEDVRAAVLSPLTARACELYFSEEKSTRCATCRSTVSEMQSDLVALDGIKSQAIARIQELTAPPEEEGVRTERVKLAEFFNHSLDSPEAIEAAIQHLREYLLKLTSENVRIIVE